ncbi:hypothetical protein V6Z11_D09G061200 [Gossypium hirsutum]
MTKDRIEIETKFGDIKSTQPHSLADPNRHQGRWPASRERVPDLRVEACLKVRTLERRTEEKTRSLALSRAGI